MLWFLILCHLLGALCPCAPRYVAVCFWRRRLASSRHGRQTLGATHSTIIVHRVLIIMGVERRGAAVVAVAALVLMGRLRARGGEGAAAFCRSLADRVLTVIITILRSL